MLYDLLYNYMYGVPEGSKPANLFWPFEYTIMYVIIILRIWLQLNDSNLVDIFQYVLIFLQIVLNSMHKYQPRIHLVKVSDVTNMPITSLDDEEHRTFAFPESIFIGVTAYQNQLVSMPRNEYMYKICKCHFWFITKTWPCNKQRFFSLKNENFSRKMLIFFLFLLEAVHYPQSMFYKKNRYTPAYPSFTI